MTILRRKADRVVSQAEIAWLRFRAYDELRSPDAALEFLENAITLSPTNVTYRCVHLIQLERMKRIVDLIPLATAYLEDNSMSLRLRGTGAGVLINVMPEMSGEDARKISQLIVDSLGPADREIDASAISSLRGSWLVAFAIALDKLGRHEESMTSFRSAAELDIRRGGSWVAFLPEILEALRNHDDAAIAGVIDRVRGLTREPGVTAMTHQWAAIAAVQGGRIADAIDELRIALELSPDSRNVERMIARLKSAETTEDLAINDLITNLAMKPTGEQPNLIESEFVSIPV